MGDETMQDDHTSALVERADARGLRLVGLWGMSEMQALVARRDPLSAPAERKLAGGERVAVYPVFERFEGDDEGIRRSQ